MIASSLLAIQTQVDFDKQLYKNDYRIICNQTEKTYEPISNLNKKCDNSLSIDACSVSMYLVEKLQPDINK